MLTWRNKSQIKRNRKLRTLFSSICAALSQSLAMSGAKASVWVPKPKKVDHGRSVPHSGILKGAGSSQHTPAGHLYANCPTVLVKLLLSLVSTKVQPELEGSAFGPGWMVTNAKIGSHARGCLASRTNATFSQGWAKFKTLCSLIS